MKRIGANGGDWYTDDNIAGLVYAMISRPDKCVREPQPYVNTTPESAGKIWISRPVAFTEQNLKERINKACEKGIPEKILIPLKLTQQQHWVGVVITPDPKNAKKADIAYFNSFGYIHQPKSRTTRMFDWVGGTCSYDKQKPDAQIQKALESLYPHKGTAFNSYRSAVQTDGRNCGGFVTTVLAQLASEECPSQALPRIVYDYCQDGEKLRAYHEKLYELIYSGTPHQDPQQLLKEMLGIAPVAAASSRKKIVVPAPAPASDTASSPDASSPAKKEERQPMLGQKTQMGAAIVSTLGGAATLFSLNENDKGWKRTAKILAGVALTGLGIFVGYKAMKDPSWVNRLASEPQTSRGTALG